MKVKNICKGRYPKYLVTMPNGVKREVVDSTDSVAILLYDKENERIILVQQERAPILFIEKGWPRPELFNGNIIEAVAGRLDKPDKSIVEIAISEAEEEAGIILSIEDVEIVNGGLPLALSPGLITEHCFLFYAEIKPGQLKKGNDFGLPSEGEKTTRIEIPLEDLEKYSWEDMKTFALIQWFLRTKLKK